MQVEIRPGVRLSIADLRGALSEIHDDIENAYSKLYFLVIPPFKWAAKKFIKPESVREDVERAKRKLEVLIPTLEYQIEHFY